MGEERIWTVTPAKNWTTFFFFKKRHYFIVNVLLLFFRNRLIWQNCNAVHRNEKPPLKASQRVSTWNVLLILGQLTGHPAQHKSSCGDCIRVSWDGYGITASTDGTAAKTLQLVLTYFCQWKGKNHTKDENFSPVSVLSFFLSCEREKPLWFQFTKELTTPHK